MKNPVRILVAIAAVASLAFTAKAQDAAPKILVFDMAKVFANHYKTKEQTAKLKADEQKAEQELDRLNKEGNALVEQFKDLNAQASNPTATDAAKEKAKAAAQAKYEEIQKKQEEVQQFRVNTQQALQQRFGAFRQILIEEITKVAVEIAKQKGATLLLDSSGATANGIPSVIYSDPSLDITNEVLAVVNKNAPADAPAVAPATAPSSTPAPAATAPANGPTITVPGSK
ncbi:outer membrane protein (OmpH-like) [mine drainage metagenome]|uniref:Outer membrane protein (OmpH-like) n=1 Tax=mine drainage metagenome TaxID=410659 RepID=A0A1J5S6Q2_9ZZZZ